ncbi:C1 family peptidase, partial [Candidatus Aminicenantes bacterium AC-334-E05]|nr:C1 family peptidase [Candidatus Aminicenantes bacterium AC-334-E05]
IKKYGIVRASDYTGLLSGKKTHDHTELFKELKAYLNFLKENNYWDEETAIEYVKAILNKHLGKPPEKIIVDGKEMTPKEYLDNVLQLPLDDYVAIISFKYLPFYTKGEYKVPDNWWHSKDYYNVPLDEFYKAIVNAIKNGFTVAIGGDISEPGKSGEEDIAIIPSFDIPFSCINQDSREFRFYNKTSTDDHAVHLVGYKRIGNHDWFLIKDSGRSAFVGKFKGYYFYRDDYIKLKMLNILVHKDAVKDLLSKFKE